MTSQAQEARIRYDLYEKMLFLIAENAGSRKLFFERVKENLNMCKTMYHGEYLILGDFNIDFKNSTHPDTVELRGLMCKF